MCKRPGETQPKGEAAFNVFGIALCSLPAGTLTLKGGEVSAQGDICAVLLLNCIWDLVV
jgi:hypothetical protein